MMGFCFFGGVGMGCYRSYMTYRTYGTYEKPVN
jgi:hypothetical protein